MLEDILRDTWFYQRILKEGEQKGHEGGIEEGIEEERKKELQRFGKLLVDGVEAKFPSLVALARQCADSLNDPDALQKITFQLFTIQDPDIARGYLLAALEEKQNSN